MGSMVYLASEQLSLSTNQKEMLLAISSDQIQPSHLSSSGVPVGLAGHVGLLTTCLLPDLDQASTPPQYTYRWHGQIQSVLPSYIKRRV